MPANDERWWEAELYRLKGELTLVQGSQSTQSDSKKPAENYFDKARRATSNQGAKSLELRAATSLGRLWTNRAKSLRPSECWARHKYFKEGLDLPDLQEAKALLEA